MTALFLLAMYLGQVRETLDAETSHRLVDQLLHIPLKLEELLRRDSIYEDLTRSCSEPPIFCIWAAASISPSPSRAR